jgi:hypothetical protein
VPSRKTHLDRPGDVPSGIVAALVVWLLAIFVPLASITPDLPTSLPPLPVRDDAILDFHARLTPARGAPYLDESVEALARASATHDPQAIARAQRELAAFVVDAAGDDQAARDALRERYLRRFLAALESGARDPMLATAARHRLVGPDAAPGVTRAMLVAWFDFRWEAVTARETLRDQPIPLGRLIERLPLAEQRALVAWALRVDCDALLGTPPRRPLAPEQLAQCAALRQEFVGLARVLPGSDYPVDEARAAVHVLHARELLRSAAAERDLARRGAMEHAAASAYAQAHAIYSLLAEQRPSRRLQRYLLGSSRGMGQ